MRVTILDYGAGNLHSLAKALSAPDRDVRVETDARRAIATDALVLPGVGAFAPASKHLAPVLDALRDTTLGGLPVLGICLGMQLLFDESDEGGGKGLGIFSGRVTLLRAERRPQIGWNALEDVRDRLITDARLESVYYANSYACRPVDESVVTAWSTYGPDRFAAAVRRGSCRGVQFHPEKSSRAGVRFIDGWLRESSSISVTPSSAVTT